MVPTEEERLPIRVPIPVRGLNHRLRCCCTPAWTRPAPPLALFNLVFILSLHPCYFLLVSTHGGGFKSSILFPYSVTLLYSTRSRSCFEASVSNNVQGHCDFNISYFSSCLKASFSTLSGWMVKNSKNPGEQNCYQRKTLLSGLHYYIHSLFKS